MLVLTRELDETITIGPDIEVTVVRISGNKVRLGINAPRNVAVDRKEVVEARAKDGTRLRPCTICGGEHGDKCPVLTAMKSEKRPSRKSRK